ncbi:MAG: sulfatase-like hydrolase/transferase [Lentisphaerae bacterium]|jgi:arylsulfatase|nr:sulfatase-like hydrolase/transferase [Lentisphaerota bacterium]MBT4817582.1 sulfatase-like hydrolase/transferase [Lentisphaerota bacterium]MBT5608527.1 sulfatase-like hydrolase/transferase [Lentisphaerota bacterium]MBT7060240.1 sulfatase-like hydrolase/transferase [Lentisphaerota bacterium]MBT7843244.1 sulfatase-like hydrolase/transferase [Lentisphaerota bacterium]
MDDRPNILLITTDHLRYDTLGCHGDPVIRTPNIDRLAAQSVDFSNYFVQNPVCQPSRASLMTGRYPRNHGVRHNGSRLDQNEMTLMEFVKREGYATACVGKHHIAQERFVKALDHVSAAHIRRNWREREDGQYVVEEPNELEQYVRDRGHEYTTGYALPHFRARLGAVPSELPEDCHIDAYVGKKGKEYLQQSQPHQPFFLWLGFYGPHHPYVPSGRFGRMYTGDDVPPFARAESDLARKPPEYRIYCECHDHKYRGFSRASDTTFREMKAAYYGMVSQIDWQVGEILDTLDENGLADNTIVVFTSDHGEFLGDHGIPAKAPFLLDCMLHVPFMVRGPDMAPRQTDELTEEVDLFPTVARLTGGEIPAWVQGQDLSPALGGGVLPNSRDTVYAEMVDKRCVRTREWKYIHYPGKPHGELYNVSSDPHELRNLYTDRPDIVTRMRQRYYDTLDATEDLVHPTYQRFSGVDPETGEELTHYHTW